MKVYRFFAFLSIVVSFVFSCKQGEKELQIEDSKEPINWNNEVLYHVMPRSFYDSNGDLHGDLNGFVEKLDYLKELGVTTILFTPLYESDFYHNYFPTNYYNIDQEYGTKDDYINFVKAVHKKGLKFLMDMETQYAQEGNIWFDDSYKNPASKYSGFIYYTDSLNEYPEQIFLPAKSPLFDFKAWPGDKHNIVILDLNQEPVKEWMKEFYLYWVDPNKDGKFDDGVDGFRIDHIMDDLDYKGIITNMYSDFWRPIFTVCREVNPNIFILGEQANWGEYGDDMVNRSDADACFNFPLKFALSSKKSSQDMYENTKVEKVEIDPNQVRVIVDSTLSKFKKGKYNVNFIENHDTERYATIVGEDKGLMKVAAILNVFLPGIPSIYYGQELGLTGAVQEWDFDANHIPIREAFPWTNDYMDKGNAVWYKDTGEWWDISFWQTEAIKQLALPEQQKNKASLWRHYQKLLELRKVHEALRLGDYQPLLEGNQTIFGFKRSTDNESISIVTNVTSEPINLPNFSISKQQLLYSQHWTLDGNNLTIQPYGFLIYKNESSKRR